MSLQRYRIEAGTGQTWLLLAGKERIRVELALCPEVYGMRIVSVPQEFERMLGSPLHRLENWLAAKYGGCQKRRVREGEGGGE